MGKCACNSYRHVTMGGGSPSLVVNLSDTITTPPTNHSHWALHSHTHIHTNKHSHTHTHTHTHTLTHTHTHSHTHSTQICTNTESLHKHDCIQTCDNLTTWLQALFSLITHIYNTQEWGRNVWSSCETVDFREDKLLLLKTWVGWRNQPELDFESIQQNKS